MIISPSPPRIDWQYDGTVDTNSSSATFIQTRDLSESQKKRIIEQSKGVFQAQVEITDLEETLEEHGDSFKNHVKVNLANKIAEAIREKATYTQIKIEDPMPVTRIKARVVVMSEQELMDLIDTIRNY